MTLDAAGTLVARVVGGAALGYGVLDWLARDANADVQRPVLQAEFAGNAVNTVVIVIGIGGGIGNALMWFWVVVFALFAVGDAYFVRTRTGTF